MRVPILHRGGASPGRAPFRALAGGLAFAGGLALAASSAPARAEGLIDEVWVGAFAHDLSNLDSGKESGRWDLQLEVDSAQPRLLRAIGAPHVNGVLQLDTGGLTSFAAVGLMWDHRLYRRLYASADFGIGVSDGVVNPAPGPAGDYDREHRLLLGSRALFREAVGVQWRLTRRWFVGAEFTHCSNGHILASHYNEGITDAGLRIGYRFR